MQVYIICAEGKIRLKLIIVTTLTFVAGLIFIIKE